jgi:hypothetical protein
MYGSAVAKQQNKQALSVALFGRWNPNLSDMRNESPRTHKVDWASSVPVWMGGRTVLQ